MITVEIQMEIEAPPETVFDLLADHTKHPLWDPIMIEAKLYTEGPIKKGSKGMTVGEWRGKRLESDIYYDAYDRPKWVSGGTTSGIVVSLASSAHLLALPLRRAFFYLFPRLDF